MTVDFGSPLQGYLASVQPGLDNQFKLATQPSPILQFLQQLQQQKFQNRQQTSLEDYRNSESANAAERNRVTDSHWNQDMNLKKQDALNKVYDDIQKSGGDPQTVAALKIRLAALGISPEEASSHFKEKMTQPSMEPDLGPHQPGIEAGDVIKPAQSTGVFESGSDYKTLMAAREAQQQEKEAALLGQNQRHAESMAMQKLGIETASADRAAARGMAASNMGTSGQTPEEFAKALMEGRGKWPTNRDLKDPDKKAGWIMALHEDPSLNENTFALRSKAHVDATTGRTGKTLESVDTALLHLGRYVRNTGNIPDTGNKLANYVWQPVKENLDLSRDTSVALGAARTDVGTLAAELENAYRSGGGTEKGIEWFQSQLNPALPEETRRGNAKEIAELVLGKRNESVAKINRAFPKDKGLPLDMDDSTKEALASVMGGRRSNDIKPAASPNGATIKMTFPDGSIKSVPISEREKWAGFGGKETP